MIGIQALVASHHSGKQSVELEKASPSGPNSWGVDHRSGGAAPARAGPCTRHPDGFQIPLPA